MEEAKAAAYYDELTRKGEGAAKFKQGLGFSSASTNSGEFPVRGSAFVSSSSSFLSSFVKASSPSKAPEIDRKSQLASIQNKLRAKKENQKSPSREEARVSRRRSRSRSRERARRSRRRSRSRSRSRSGERRRDGNRDRDRDRDRRRSYRRNRSPSPEREKKPEKRNVGVDYSRLIKGYDRMSPAEKVKAKMKLQLSETVEKDVTKGSLGWERFEFNKDAPLDDEEIEAAGDDTALVKKIGQSFRFTAVEAKREQDIRDAHEEAIFGVPVISHVTTESEVESEADPDKVEPYRNEVAAENLLSEKVLAKQQGSWRDRARKPANSQE